MAWAQDMKSLVSDIKTSAKDRLQFVKDNQKNTHDLLSMFNKELKEMAADLKDFLAKSEQNRMADFKTTMKDIRSRIENIQKHVAGLLGDYAGERKEARANWGTLRRKERASAGENAEEVKKEAKTARKHKAK